MAQHSISQDRQDCQDCQDRQAISCSRRTDVPAFKMPWVLDRIRARSVVTENPRNREQRRIVSLDPAHVKAWVWWSKDYAPWIEAWQNPETGPLLRQYDAHIFNFTINGDSPRPGQLGQFSLEPGLRTTLDQRLEQLSWLAATFGPESIVLRFDPIVHWRATGVPVAGAGASSSSAPSAAQQPLQIQNNLESFEKIAQFANVIGIHFIVIAFALPYRHVCARMRKYAHAEIVDPTHAEKRAIIERLRNFAREISAAAPFQIRLCCMPAFDGEIENVGTSSCIDGNQIDAVLARNGRAPLAQVMHKRAIGQRDACHCTRSIDIAGYGAEWACPHACLYCYANPQILP